ncbi:hypothetical protein [Burkholderia sp. JP2-270]|uniref:hypothetical protein n=1 Tax=Burkholderia sp. JP2-270 TaxID=2217913 RepID=UPI0013A6D994|nr:hypothetical protein [Burkholderia sp. JP2-270]
MLPAIRQRINEKLGDARTFKQGATQRSRCVAYHQTPQNSTWKALIYQAKRLEKTD